MTAQTISFGDLDTLESGPAVTPRGEIGGLGVFNPDALLIIDAETREEAAKVLIQTFNVAPFQAELLTEQIEFAQKYVGAARRIEDALSAGDQEKAKLATLELGLLSLNFIAQNLENIEDASGSESPFNAGPVS